VCVCVFGVGHCESVVGDCCVVSVCKEIAAWRSPLLPLRPPPKQSAVCSHVPQVAVDPRAAVVVAAHVAHAAPAAHVAPWDQVDAERVVLELEVVHVAPHPLVGDVGPLWCLACASAGPFFAWYFLCKSEFLLLFLDLAHVHVQRTTHPTHRHSTHTHTTTPHHHRPHR
jgi:hypothetical protein